MSTAPPKTKAEAFDLSSIVPSIKVEKPRKSSDKFSMVLFGEPKVGKTSLAAGAAEVEALGPVLVLAAEDGTSVLANNYDDIDVVNIQNWDQFAALVPVLAGVDPTKDDTAFTEEPQTPYVTVFIDTIYEAMELLKLKITGGTRQLTQPEWGTLAEKTINMVKLLHRSPHVNALFLTHTEKVKDEATGKVEVGPSFLGKKTYPEVLKVVDIIAYLAVTKSEEGDLIRVLQTQSDGKYAGGDRTGKLAPQIINPSMGEIYAQLSA